MTDPTTLSLDDLAAAVVALGAHRKLQCIIDAADSRRHSQGGRR